MTILEPFFKLNHWVIISVMKIVSAVCGFYFYTWENERKVRLTTLWSHSQRQSASKKMCVCVCMRIKIEVATILFISTKQLSQFAVNVNFMFMYFHYRLGSAFMIQWKINSESVQMYEASGRQRWMIEDVYMKFQIFVFQRVRK